MPPDLSSDHTGIILVDHGSRRPESNAMLHTATERFAAQSEYSLVEPAHMELAEPSIEQAFERCVRRGARRIIVFPYFLSPGRHWTIDIPALVRAAASRFPEIPWLVTAPFGLHPGMLQVIEDRIRHCQEAAANESSASGCDVCESSGKCEFHHGTTE